VMMLPIWSNGTEHQPNNHRDAADDICSDVTGSKTATGARGLGEWFGELRLGLINSVDGSNSNV